MADLSVEFGGVEFRNRVLTGSASLGNHPPKLRWPEEARASSIVIKLASAAVLPRADSWPSRAAMLVNAAWSAAGGDRPQSTA